jgi:hypothetical protein
MAAGMGSLKLTPEQSLSSMMVVNNRTALFGDALPALIRGSGKCLGIDERMVGEGDARTAVCKITRLHRLPDNTLEREVVERRFSVADAKVAKLWQKKGFNGKDTPWITHPDRMLQMRARGFAARDGWADILMGMGIVEELQDIEPHEPVQSPQDQASDAQAAIDALKPAQSAPDPRVDPEPSKGNQRQTVVKHAKPEHHEAQTSAPAGASGGGDPANHEQEADAGTGQEQGPTIIDDSGGFGGDDEPEPTPQPKPEPVTARRTTRKESHEPMLTQPAPEPAPTRPAKPTRPWNNK